MCVFFVASWVGLPSVIANFAGACKSCLFVGHIYFETVDIRICQPPNAIFTSTK